MQGDLFQYQKYAAPTLLQGPSDTLEWQTRHPQPTRRRQLRSLSNVVAPIDIAESAVDAELPCATSYGSMANRVAFSYQGLAVPIHVESVQSTTPIVGASGGVAVDKVRFPYQSLARPVLTPSAAPPSDVDWLFQGPLPLRKRLALRQRNFTFEPITVTAAPAPIQGYIPPRHPIFAYQALARPVLTPVEDQQLPCFASYGSMANRVAFSYQGLAEPIHVPQVVDAVMPAVYFSGAMSVSRVFAYQGIAEVVEQDIAHEQWRPLSEPVRRKKRASPFVFAQPVLPTSDPAPPIQGYIPPRHPIFAYQALARPVLTPAVAAEDLQISYFANYGSLDKRVAFSYQGLAAPVPFTQTATDTAMPSVVTVGRHVVEKVFAYQAVADVFFDQEVSHEQWRQLAEPVRRRRGKAMFEFAPPALFSQVTTFVAGVSLVGLTSTLSASAAFSPGTKTATASLIGLTSVLVASAAFSVGGVKVADVDLFGSTSLITASVAFSPGTKTAATALVGRTLLLASTVTFVGPPTATVTLVGSQTIVAASVTFSGGTKTATVALVGKTLTLASTTVVHYKAAVSLTSQTSTLAATASHTAPTYLAVVSLVSSGSIVQASMLFAEAGFHSTAIVQLISKPTLLRAFVGKRFPPGTAFKFEAVERYLTFEAVERHTTFEAIE